VQHARDLSLICWDLERLTLFVLLVMLRVGGGLVRLEMCAATRAGCGVLCGVFLENQQKTKNTGCIPWKWVLRAFGLRVSPCNSN
jgi:hypothetical protein